MAGGSTPDRSGPWLRAPIAAAILVLLLGAKLWLAAASGLAKDEGYYTLWSLFPAAGYLDHPPLVAWLIAAGRWLAGDSTLGVRLMGIASSVIVTAALYRTGLLLFGRRTAFLAVIWYNLSIATGMGFIMTPDIPSVLFWMLTVWAVAEFAASSNPNWWLVAGLCAGFGVLGKYTNLFLGLGLVLFIFSDGERRRWLRLPQLWVGGAIALAVTLPNIVWNAAHGWATVRFQGRRIGDLATEGNLTEWLAGQALFLGPPLFAFAVVGALWFLLSPQRLERRGLALPVMTSLPLWLYLAVHSLGARVEANWVLPVWPMLTLVAAWGALHPWQNPAGRTVARYGAVAQPLLAGAGLLLVYAQIAVQPFENTALDRTRELRGWAELQAEISRTASEAGADWIATSNDYGLTGQLVAYGLFAGDERPVRPLGEPLRYAFMASVSEDLAGTPGLYVASAPGGQAPGVPAEMFEAAELLSILPRQSGNDVIEFYAVYRVTGSTGHAE